MGTFVSEILMNVLTMAEPLADATDVRSRINLPESTPDGNGVSDVEIQTYIQDATDDIELDGSLNEMDDTLRKHVEWRLAAIKILSQRKGSRSVHQHSLGSMSRSYEVKTIEELKDWLKRHGYAGLIEDNEFWHTTIKR